MKNRVRNTITEFDLDEEIQQLSEETRLSVVVRNHDNISTEIEQAKLQLAYLQEIIPKQEQLLGLLDAKIDELTSRSYDHVVFIYREVKVDLIAKMRTPIFIIGVFQFPQGTTVPVDALKVRGNSFTIADNFKTDILISTTEDDKQKAMSVADEFISRYNALPDIVKIGKWPDDE